ncbi:hypothetical protein NDU88_001994 [Pleurodeles waltl]|uniref:Uncharacterized protein n=1 Tax=Pleurodeles waltl TaxID=8319 RepID=A0AAV7NF26_PLEWA|nr:hypothetical protein NDU88_001994 [Pleurodeles waltl]
MFTIHVGCSAANEKSAHDSKEDDKEVGGRVRGDGKEECQNTLGEVAVSMRESDPEEENEKGNPEAGRKREMLREEAVVDVILKAVPESGGRCAAGGPETFDSLEGHWRSKASRHAPMGQHGLPRCEYCQTGAPRKNSDTCRHVRGAVRISGEYFSSPRPSFPQCSMSSLTICSFLHKLYPCLARTKVV